MPGVPGAEEKPRQKPEAGGTTLIGRYCPDTFYFHEIYNYGSGLFKYFVRLKIILKISSQCMRVSIRV